MTSKRRENINLVSFICLSFLVISFSKQLLINQCLIKYNLFQALSQCGRLKKRAGDEWGLVEKEGATGEPVSTVFRTSFRYTSSWYTL